MALSLPLSTLAHAPESGRACTHDSGPSIIWEPPNRLHEPQHKPNLIRHESDDPVPGHEAIVVDIELEYLRKIGHDATFRPTSAMDGYLTPPDLDAGNELGRVFSIRDAQSHRRTQERFRRPTPCPIHVRQAARHGRSLRSSSCSSRPRFPPTPCIEQPKKATPEQSNDCSPHTPIRTHESTKVAGGDHVVAAAWLLAAGAEQDVANRAGETPLEVAISTG